VKIRGFGFGLRWGDHTKYLWVVTGFDCDAPFAKEFVKYSCKDLDGGTVVSTAASQRQGPRFNSGLG